jgi:preprotein translocase subunit SecA
MLLTKIFGDPNEKFVKGLQPTVDEINSLESIFEKLSDEELKEKTKELKEKLKNNDLDKILVQAFALVREASKRTLGQRHFDVQLIGGIVLHQSKIAEMKTGEGKTLVATLPAYLNALAGKGVHIVTVNDYLAKRDAVWMGQIYYALGLSVSCIVHDKAFLYDPNYTKEFENKSLAENQLDKERDLKGGFKVIESYLRPISRKEAYLADILYGTNNEFGFDYLKDNLVYKPTDVVQRELNFAIVDEVDSILIDESRTPLIISVPDQESMHYYKDFAMITPQLKEETDYTVDKKYRAVSLTEEGIKKIENILNIDNVYAEKGFKYLHFLEQSLKAEILFKKDRDYIVKDGEVLIVDEFTGRILPGRRYSGGLHQAIEAKEKVMVQPESRTMASISFQNYFRMYKKLAGMTGTALTSAEEFHKVYNLEVIVVPTNKPMIRIDLPDRVFRTKEGKNRAIVKEIKNRHEKGQPILVGTVSIEKNEYLGKLLEREGVPHEILNAKNHEKEGEIIAQAGKLRAATVATNMAGRGVDIILGGNPFQEQELKKVKELGGLFIIGTERHEARRIDNQLRGRAGRQGDPGATQFFLSMDDELLKIFGGDQMKGLLEKFDFPEDEPIENKTLSGIIEGAQSKIEAMNFDLRKYLLEYDDVLNKHREVVYKKRKEILNKNDVKSEILGFLKNEIERIIDFHCQDTDSKNWNKKEIIEQIKTIGLNEKEVAEKVERAVDAAEIKKSAIDLVKKTYEQKEEKLGKEQMRFLEKILLLQIIDFLWTSHLEDMDYLREVVRLRAYGQQDPLIEYKKEGYLAFQNFLGSFETQVARTILNIEPVKSSPRSARLDSESKRTGGVAEKIEDKKIEMGEVGKRIGRNDPCPCGSGKKYKKCHGA